MLSGNLFDPTDTAFLADPYPVFAQLREAGPVHWHDGLGQFVAVSHEACNAMFRDRGMGRIWKDKEPAEAFPAFNLLHRTSILESEPPTHTRLRRLVAGAFGRGHVERMRPWIAELATDLVGGLAEKIDADGSADLIEQVAEPLPVEVIAELLSVPAADRGLLRPWSNTIVKMYEPDLDAVRQGEAEAAAAGFVAYLRELIADRRRHPRENDLICDLVAAADGSDRLDDDEIVGTCALLLMAGHEATVNVIGNGLRAMWQGRADGESETDGAPWQRLVGDGELIPTAAEEMIRYDSSLQLFERTAVRQVEIAGVRIEPGQKIAALLGAANRDPAVFTDPDGFDIGRSPNAHLGFGAGIHFCLGAPLARIEVQSLLAALRTRLPGIRLAETPVRRPEFVIRSLYSLDVTV